MDTSDVVSTYIRSLETIETSLLGQLWKDTQWVKPVSPSFFVRTMLTQQRVCVTDVYNILYSTVTVAGTYTMVHTSAIYIQTCMCAML